MAEVIDLERLRQLNASGVPLAKPTVAALIDEVERLAQSELLMSTRITEAEKQVEAAKSVFVRHIVKQGFETARTAGIAVDEAVRVVAEILENDPVEKFARQAIQLDEANRELETMKVLLESMRRTVGTTGGDDLLRAVTILQTSHAKLKDVLEAKRARVEGLHKPITRYLPFDGAEISFATPQEAAAHAEDCDLPLSVWNPDAPAFPSFQICAECSRIESEQMEEMGVEEWSFREGLWPCKTSRVWVGVDDV